MKKIFASAILLAVLLIGTACAEEDCSPAAAPEEINHPNSIYYRQPDFYNMTSTADKIILTHYPTYQQTTEYTCGPASALTVLHYFDVRNFDEKTLAAAMKTNPDVGTSLGNMVKFFKGLGWNVESSLDTPPMNKFAFEKFVMKNLSEGKPIMVENVEFGGHWRVIIGCDTLGTPDDILDDVLIFADPFDMSDHKQDGYAFGSLDRFYSMWFDYYLLPETERNQPWLIATPREN